MTARSWAEAALERECVAEVKRRGGLYRKLDVGHGAKGWLDDAVWLPGRHFVVEFKLPGEAPNSKQVLTIQRLRALGVEVHVITSFAAFVSVLDA